VKYGRAIRRVFSTYAEAVRFLTGMRFKEDEGTLDPREYQADSPLDIGKLVDEYLDERAKLKTSKDLMRFLHSAVAAMPGSIKGVTRPKVKAWLKALNCGDKTKANYLSALSAFLKWCKDEEHISEVPSLPKVEFELGWRRVTNWETQQAIVDVVREIAPPKVWLAVELLRTYTCLRPGDITRITEADAGDVLTIWRPTKKKEGRKTVRLLPEHAELISQLRVPALPAAPYFRHDSGRLWGEKYIYKWWVRACERLGIEGLDLYGGTRHTSTTELAKIAGRDGAKEASGHQTNKAFDRYCQTQSERAFEMAKLVRHHQGTTVSPLKKTASS
jgi:integrase